MANLALVSALRESKRSVHNKKNDTQRIAEQVIIVKSAIASIVAIVDTQSGSVGDFSKHLLSLSVFFREEKFEKIIVPVLSILQKDDLDKWAIAKIRNTQMPLIPQSFEDLPKSVAEIRCPRGGIQADAQLSREKHLLSVYMRSHITELKQDDTITHASVDILMGIVIGKIFRTLANQ